MQTEPSPNDSSPHVYSWCMTDHKAGTAIRSGWRTVDYMNDEPYATCLKDMLEKLGLPQPTYKDIFRGTRHDLLFLASHGVVLRIGPTDVTKLIGPGVLQPLGWLENKDLMIGELPFTIAIYPGVELSHLMRGVPQVGDLEATFRHARQEYRDMYDCNMGFVSIANDFNDTVAIHLAIDIDNGFMELSSNVQKKVTEALEKFKQQSGSIADAMSHTMQYVYGHIPNFTQYLRAFNTHQPLREMFWEAFKNTDAPDTTARDKFWEACACLTNSPHKAVYPLWRMEKDADGNPTFRREEVRIQQLALYTPWTYNPTNKVIKPISPEELAERKKREEEKKKKKEEARIKASLSPWARIGYQLHKIKKGLIG